MLALFPSTIVVVALVGLVSDGERTVDTVVDLARQVGAGSVVGNDGVVGVVRAVVVAAERRQGAARASVCSARSGRRPGFIGAFTRASNAIYGVTEGRPVWKLRPLQIGAGRGDAGAARGGGRSG